MTMVESDKVGHFVSHNFMAKYKCTITPPSSACKSFNVLFPHFLIVFKWLYQQGELWRVKMMMV